jgi:hypothetical protein
VVQIRDLRGLGLGFGSFLSAQGLLVDHFVSVVIACLLALLVRGGRLGGIPGEV